MLIREEEDDAAVLAAEDEAIAAAAAPADEPADIARLTEILADGREPHAAPAPVGDREG